GLAFFFYTSGMDMLSPFLMLIPLLVSLPIHKFLLKRPIFGSKGMGFQLGRKRFLLMAPLLSLLFTVVVYVISYLFNPDLFSVEQASVSIKDMATFNESHSLLQNILIAGAIQLLIAPLLNILIFIGEEAGWRSFLYPNLIAMYGKRGLIFGGL